jgi:hypothetical protein
MQLLSVLSLHLEGVEIILFANFIAIVNFMEQKWVIDA